MEFYNLGRVVFSRHISSHQKKDAIARSLTKISLSFTSGITVAILGQILIPIPVVGALIGGFLGGLVGGAIGDKIEHYKRGERERIDLERLALNLVDAINQQGFWDF
mgnify:CR=1 FL=1